MPSFDVVSRVDLMEVDNAVNGSKREINQRYDLSGTKCGIERNADSLVLTADDNMKLGQVSELFRKYLVKRKLDVAAFDFGTPQPAGGDSLRQVVEIVQGIDAELSKRVTKAIKSTPLKVQVATQGNELRVTAKKRDTLQATIKFIKEMEVKQPLQFVNYRE